MVLMTMGAKAQTLQNVRNFIGGLQNEFIIGYNTSVASEPFSSAIIGYNLGVTTRHEVIYSPNGTFDAYALTGLILTSRGGKVNLPIDQDYTDDNVFRVGSISLPIHVGGDINIQGLSLFADLGPHVLIRTGRAGIANLSEKRIALGTGYNIGVRFSRFAVSFGFDKDFTKLGKFTPDSVQRHDLQIYSSQETFNLIDGEFHLNLRWAF